MAGHVGNRTGCRARSRQPAREKATNAILDNEAGETQQLRELGMTVIGEEDGLDNRGFPRWGVATGR